MEHGEAGAVLREVAVLFAQVQREGIACCGTTSTQCSVITELGRGGPMTLAELGRRLGLDKGWTSRTVEALVQEGLLLKEPSATDRRTVIISLTAEGEARYGELNSSLNGQSTRILNRIAPAERERVVRALTLVREALRAEAAGEPVLIALEEGEA